MDCSNRMKKATFELDFGHVQKGLSSMRKTFSLLCNKVKNGKIIFVFDNSVMMVYL